MLRKWTSICLLFLAACSGTQPYASGGVASASAVASTAPEAVDSSDYKLGTTDKVKVTVYNEPTLSGEFVIGPNKTISFPLIGAVEAQGMTASELAAALTARLGDGYLRDPKVAVEVLTYRPFYILGEVNKPGQYDYSQGMTILQAIATAEGFTYRANKKTILLKRAGSEQEVSTKITPSLPVRPGDTIRIAERYF